MEIEPKWPAIVRHCEEEIKRLHNSLEVIQPDATTNQLRGEIRALRRVLKLAEPQLPEHPQRMIQPGTDSFV